MSLIDPVAIAVIATALTTDIDQPPDAEMQERRFREALREYPPHAIPDIPAYRDFHKAFYRTDPYLDVAFVETGGWCNGRFIHEPLRPPRTSEDLMSQNPWIYWEYFLTLRLEGMFGPRIRPSPALQKAIRRVLDEPDTGEQPAGKEFDSEHS